MALLKETKDRIAVALAHRKSADDLIKAVESGANLQAAHVADVTEPDATDLPTAEALANANKAKINEILAALQAAGLMA